MEKILRLPVVERIQLVQEIWDSIAEIPEAVQLSDEHRAILRERLEAHRCDPSAISPWEEVKNRLESKFPKR